MDSQLEDRLTKKSAVVAGISFIVAVTGISAFSQWQPNHTIASSLHSVNTSNRTPVQTATTPLPVLPLIKTTPLATSTASITPNKFSTPPSSSQTTTDNPKPSKPPLRVQQTAQSIVSSKGKSLEPTRDDASTTASGLSEARQAKIKPDKTWKKAQLAISLMRQGKTRRQAARLAGISKATLKRFIESGKN